MEGYTRETSKHLARHWPSGQNFAHQNTATQGFFAHNNFCRVRFYVKGGHRHGPIQPNFNRVYPYAVAQISHKLKPID